MPLLPSPSTVMRGDSWRRGSALAWLVALAAWLTPGDARALEPIPDKLVVLTFDDAARSHYEVARPLLKAKGFGATFFISEGWDFATNKKDYMTWQQIRALHDDGFEIGNDGRDGTPYYRDDPDALPRIFVGPYFAFAPDLAWVLEDDEGVCGYCLGAADSTAFYDAYERHWRPDLMARFPAPTGSPATWTRAQQIHYLYHHPDHLIPGPSDHYPAHVHIDLLPRAQGRSLGKKMMGILLDELRRRGLSGVHLGVGTVNARAQTFYRKLGFAELCRVGGDDGCTYMGLRLDASPASTAERRDR